MARRIFCPVWPTTSAMTLVSWMFIWVSAFCMCCTSLAWLRSSIARWRHSERSTHTKNAASQSDLRVDSQPPTHLDGG